MRLRSPRSQGVRREVESKGYEEKYRAVVDGGCPDDEPIGQRLTDKIYQRKVETISIRPSPASTLNASLNGVREMANVSHNVDSLSLTPVGTQRLGTIRNPE